MKGPCNDLSVSKATCPFVWTLYSINKKKYALISNEILLLGKLSLRIGALLLTIDNSS